MAEGNGVGRFGVRSYVSPISTLWDNLTHYYSGDNNANDSKGTAHGTLVNGTTYGAGKINNGFDFDGINDYISFPVNTFKPTGDFSISFWFYKKNNNNGGYMSFTEIGQPYYGNGMFGYNYHGGFAFEINGGRDIVTPFIPNDTWTHIVITHKDSTNYKIYTNGVLATPVTPINDTTYPNTRITTVNPNFSSNNIAMTMNGVAGGGYPGAIKLDEIALFDGIELTAAKITELYNAGAGKQYPAPTPTYTARTQALIAATGLTDTDKINAINIFDLGLISNNLPFSADDALYLGVLGSNAANAFNFIDTAKYKLTLNGGWTSTTGLKGNNTNSYAQTGWIPSARISGVNNGSWGFYSRNNINTISGYYYPLISNSPSANGFGAYKYMDGRLYSEIQNNSFDGIAPYKWTGMFQSSRSSSTVVETLVSQTNYTFTRSSAGLSTTEVTLGDISLRTGIDYCCTYLSANQWTLVQKQTFDTLSTTFLTTLGLNV